MKRNGNFKKIHILGEKLNHKIYSNLCLRNKSPYMFVNAQIKVKKNILERTVERRNGRDKWTLIFHFS